MENIILSPISLESLQRLIFESVEQALSKVNPPAQKNELDVNLTIGQMAKYLDCSKATLHNYINRGSIPYHKVGRRTYFIKSEVDSALSSTPPKKERSIK